MVHAGLIPQETAGFDSLCPQMNSNERIIRAFELGYRVNNEGNPVAPEGFPLRLDKDGPGYWRFVVCSEHGRRQRVPVHRLMAFQKYGLAVFEPGTHVRHKNGNNQDNSYLNILIGTASDNSMDRSPEVRRKLAGQARRKLTDAEVAQLRTDRANGAKYSELTEKYGLCKSTISYIVRGLTCNPTS